MAHQRIKKSGINGINGALLLVTLCLALIVLMLWPNGAQAAGEVYGLYNYDGTTETLYKCDENGAKTSPETVITDRYTVTNLFVADGVTDIAKRAFYQCSALKSVTLPTSLTSIGDDAFRRSGLTSVKLPEGLTTLGRYIFGSCEELKSVELPTTLTSISDYVFDGCRALTSVKLPEGLTTLGEKMFTGCHALTSVELPKTLTSIGYGAFNNCSALTSVKLPEGLMTLGKSMFAYCSALTSVELPKTLTSIGGYAFNNSGLTSVKLPEGLTTLGDGVFYDCRALTSVELPTTLTSISNNVFSSCRALTSVKLPEGLTTLGENMFSDCSALTSVELPTTLISIGDGAFSGSGLTSVKLPEGLTTLGNLMFSSCSALTSVELPKSLTSIGGYAFSGSGLTSIKLPEGLTTLGGGMFSSCGALTSVELPTTLASIGSGAFSSSGLTSVKLPEGLTTLGDHVFGSCRALTSVKLPEGLTTLGESVFAYCRALTSVELPKTLTSIGSGAFVGSGLTSVKLPEGLTTLGDHVFAYCSALTSVELPKTLTSIGYGAFSGSGLTSVKLPEGLTTLGENVFADCSALKSVELPKSLTSIGSNVFSNCSALKSVELPKTLKSIGNYAFFGSGLTSVKLPEGLTTLGGRVFSSCSALTSVELPTSLTSIGNWTFSFSGLTSVKLPEGLTTLGNDVFFNCGALKSVELPTTLTSIGDEAFYNCSSLARITLSSAEPPTLGTNVFADLPSPRYMELVGNAATSGKYGDPWEDFTKTKLLSIEGLTATDRAYDTTTKVVLTGGSLKGIEASDNVTATMPTEGTMDNATAGENKPVSITLPTLEGAESIKYSLLAAPDIKVNIAKINQAPLSIKNSENTTYTPEAIELQAEGGSGNGAITWTKEDKTGASTLEGNKLTVTKCGTIKVTATKAGDDNYNEIAVEKDIEINKVNQAVLNISNGDTTYTPEAIILQAEGGSGSGAISFSIGAGGTGIGQISADNKLSVTKCGTIKLQAIKAGDDNHNEVRAEKEITITKAAGSGSVTLENWVYGQTPKTPVAKSATNGNTNVTYAYKAQGAEDSTYTPEQPKDVGSYTVRATFAETDNYTQVLATADFEITKASGSGSVTLENWVYGQTPKTPVAESATNGNTNVTYAYKAQGAEDSTYTPEQPKDVGSYTVRATFAETDNYTQAIATADFEITKAGKIDQEKLSIKDLENTTYTPAGFTLETEGGSGTGAVAFEVIEDKGNINAKIVGNKLTVDKEGTIKIKATKAGDATYNPATAEKEITITKAGDLKFESKTVEYDTKEHSLKVEGTIPEGCSVTYEPQSVKDAGVHTMKATISGQGYEPKTLTATLTISAVAPAITLAAEADKPIVIGQPITLTAEVKGVGGEVPTGSVTVLKQKVTLKDGKAAVVYTPETNAPVEITAVFEPDGENYTKADTKIKLTAGQKTREAITCDAIAATYGDTDMALNPKGGSLQDSESYGYEVVTGKDIIETNNNGVLTILKAGAATVRVSLPETQTYTATSCDVAVTVAKADITGITYNDQSITFDEADHSLVITGNLPQGATVAYENNTHKKPGTYSAKAMIDGGTNYNSQTLSATLTILPKEDPIPIPRTVIEVEDAVAKVPDAKAYEAMTPQEQAKVKGHVEAIVKGLTEMDKAEQAKVSLKTLQKLSELYEAVYELNVSTIISIEDGVKAPLDGENIKIYGAAVATGVTDPDSKIAIKFTQGADEKGAAISLVLELYVQKSGEKDYQKVQLKAPIVFTLGVPDSIKTEGLTISHLNEDKSLKETITPVMEGRNATIITTSFSNFLFIEKTTPVDPVKPDPVKPDPVKPDPTNQETTVTTIETGLKNPITGKALSTSEVGTTACVLLLGMTAVGVVIYKRKLKK